MIRDELSWGLHFCITRERSCGEPGKAVLGHSHLGCSWGSLQSCPPPHFQTPTSERHYSNIFCAVCAQPCLTLCHPMDGSPPGSSVHGDSPGKNTGVGCHALLQGIFPTQVSCIKADSSLSESPGKQIANNGLRYFFFFPIYKWCFPINMILQNLLRMPLHLQDFGVITSFWGGVGMFLFWIVAIIWVVPRLSCFILPFHKCQGLFIISVQFI